jgi:hypothetical protein
MWGLSTVTTRGSVTFCRRDAGGVERTPIGAVRGARITLHRRRPAGTLGGLAEPDAGRYRALASERQKLPHDQCRFWMWYDEPVAALRAEPLEIRGLS